LDVCPEKELPRLAEGETGEDGTIWVWIAFAAEYRLILALVVLPRTQPSAQALIEKTATVLVGRLPLFVSDGLDSYGVALFNRWHVEVPFPRTGCRGRPRKPANLPAPELRYAQVVKKREGRRLVEIIRRVVYGRPEEIDVRDICTSLIERLNLTLRQEVEPLSRKTLAFGKDDDELRAYLALYVAYYHFVRSHHTLRRPLPEPVPVRGKTLRRFERGTPAMAAGLTDHVWTLRELLTYRPEITSIN